MRLEKQKRKNRYKVWLTDPEIKDLRRHAGSARNDLLIQLGAFVGLRAFEMHQIKPKHVKRSQDGEHYHLRVPKGKDTKTGDGKPRDAYLPADVERDLHRYQEENGIGRNETYIDLTTSGVRQAIKRVAKRTADATGDDDFHHVSSHDLRRRYAQRLLVDEGMNPRVVMAVGGWDSFEAIKPYLNTPSEDVVNDAFEGVSVGV